MMYVRYPFSLWDVDDLLNKRGNDISHETVRFWWNRFGPMIAAEISKNRISQMRAYSNGKWHVDEGFVKINGETRYLWRAGDHEGDALKSFVTKRHSCGAAMRVMGKADRQETGRWLYIRSENSHRRAGHASI
jgi:putative transposase